MAITRECGLCDKHLPREHFACPHCGQPGRYQKAGEAANSEQHAALAERQRALPGFASEGAATQPRFMVAENAPDHASAGAVQGRATNVLDQDPPRERDPEQLLLVALGQGDQSAFWTLWDMHSSRLYGICLGEMNRNREDAEEALGQAMMKALNKLPVFAPKIISPEAWLIRLTRNLCKDIQRRRTRRRRLAGRFENTAEKIQYSGGYSFWTASRGDVFPCELERNPESMIDRLPARLREVFVLRFVQEMSYEDIATRLALTQVNVRKRIQQGRALLRALRENGITGTETRWAKCPPLETAADIAATCDTASAHTHKEFEIPAPPTLSRTICVRLPSGVQGHFEIFVDKRPSRQRQKIRTLRKYVEHHAGGWKKRLELADLLYETGAWEEAVDGYRHVLKKQPWLTAVSVRLGEILCLMSAEEEALAVYELALPLAQQESSRRHVEGLIASCHHNFPLAVASFQKATALEPNNAAHWRALAAARLRLYGLDQPPPRP